MEKIEIFKDERASNYDNFVKQWIIHYDFVLDLLPKIITMQQPTAKDIAVVGCGTGNEIDKLHACNPQWKITGIDPSPEMIEIAKSKLPTSKNIDLQCTTMGEISSIKQFDVATLFLVLHFMKDDGSKELLLKNISQKMRPGGSLIILDIFGSEEQFIFNKRLLQTLLPQEIGGVNITEHMVSMPERISNIPEERLAELLHQAGFSAPIRFFQTAIYGSWVCKKIINI